MKISTFTDSVYDYDVNDLRRFQAEWGLTEPQMKEAESAIASMLASGQQSVTVHGVTFTAEHDAPHQMTHALDPQRFTVGNRQDEWIDA